MSSMSTPSIRHNDSGRSEATFLGHPIGLFLLFFVEMWERFSYYGMRGLLVLYLTSPSTGMRILPPGREAGFNPGRGWTDDDAYNTYGWYTGMAYLTPIVGGMIADKLIGTHRSMIVGGLLIALGHVVLGVSGVGELAHNSLGMSVFVLGLALIVIGTGHFKPSVSVMVGQLYSQDDPRRESAFGIFYMGINLGSAIQTYIVGTLGERLGWHWGFGAAAAGMLLGLFVYMAVRPKLLGTIGDPPGDRGGTAAVLIPIGVVLATVTAFAFHKGWLGRVDQWLSNTWVIAAICVAAATWAVTFTVRQAPGDRGPVASIFIFMLFNAMFWLAFEQAGSSINIYTDRDTDRSMNLPGWFTDFATGASIPLGIGMTLGAAVVLGLSLLLIVKSDRRGAHTRASAWIVVGAFSLLAGIFGVLKALGNVEWLKDLSQIPTTWFQSINPWLIIAFAPVTGVMWTALARRNANPGQPYKIGFGLVMVGLGYLFLVAGAREAAQQGKAAMMWVVATYFIHTVGEIVLSPTGLSYVTKTAPRQHMSLLMGVWFISSFIANLLAGKTAAAAKSLEGKFPWHMGSEQANFFFLFTATSAGAGLIIIAFGPLLKKIMRPGVS